jgi:hypothetical protein
MKTILLMMAVVGVFGLDDGNKKIIGEVFMAQTTLLINGDYVKYIRQVDAIGKDELKRQFMRVAAAAEKNGEASVIGQVTGGKVRDAKGVAGISSDELYALLSGASMRLSMADVKDISAITIIDIIETKPSEFLVVYSLIKSFQNGTTYTGYGLWPIYKRNETYTYGVMPDLLASFAQIADRYGIK